MKNLETVLTTVRNNRPKKAKELRMKQDSTVAASSNEGAVNNPPQGDKEVSALWEERLHPPLRELVTFSGAVVCGLPGRQEFFVRATELSVDPLKGQTMKNNTKRGLIQNENGIHNKKEEMLMKEHSTVATKVVTSRLSKAKELRMKQDSNVTTTVVTSYSEEVMPIE